MDTASVEPGKIFVGGLNWETTKETLKGYFEKFGAVSDCVIMIDPITKRPRGFGFVTFSDPSSVPKVMQGGEHLIDNKRVDPKPATLKNETPGSGSQNVIKKVFVGGIESHTTDDQIREYFSQYGPVKEVDLKYDKATRRMRGFGFVEFESEEVVATVCATHFHQLNGKTVEVKKAEPRYVTASADYRNAPGGAAGMGYSQGSNFGGYSGRGSSGYSPYNNYSYGYGQQQQQQYPYGANYASGAYGGQNYGQFTQATGTYPAGGDRGYYATQQAGTATQQQMPYSQDSSAYARSGYTAADGYSSGGHSTAGYTYDNQAAAASFPQYGDSQTAGRGMGQQRGVGTYQQPYGSH